MADNRKRNFCCVLYPSKDFLDSHCYALDYDGSSGYGDMPDNFLDIIESWHVPALLSPLHDKDKDYDVEDSDGHIKKPHYHLMVMFEGKKSFSTVKALFDEICGVCTERNSEVLDRRSYARYLCHLDHPHKYQYDINDVVTFGAISYSNEIETNADTFRVLQDLQDFVKRNKTIRSYSELSDWCLDNNTDWYRILTSRCTMHFVNYFKSRHFDPVTSDDIKSTWK